MKPYLHSRASSFTLNGKRMKRCLSPELLVQITIWQSVGRTEVLAQEHTEVQYLDVELKKPKKPRINSSFRVLQKIYFKIEEQFCAVWGFKISLLSFPSEFYTLEGNAFGKPCAFPFFYKDRWFGDCTTYDSSTKRAWCAVGTRFENDQWGYCPTTCEWEHASVWKCAYVMKGSSIYISILSVSEQPVISGLKTLQQEHITSSTCSRYWLGFRLKKAANSRGPLCSVSQIHTSRPLSQVRFHPDTCSLSNKYKRKNCSA